ncbi:hypothetical protein BN2364_2008 [Alloalcanivorax xenomutans]|nr:hypothetical protein BN2364_2008 [Alloalcanivorax xenomutans]
MTGEVWKNKTPLPWHSHALCTVFNYVSIILHFTLKIPTRNRHHGTDFICPLLFCRDSLPEKRRRTLFFRIKMRPRHSGRHY